MDLTLSLAPFNHASRLLCFPSDDLLDLAVHAEGASFLSSNYCCPHASNGYHGNSR